MTDRFVMRDIIQLMLCAAPIERARSIRQSASERPAMHVALQLSPWEVSEASQAARCDWY